MHLCISAMYFCCCCPLLCCYIAVAAAPAACCCCSTRCAGWQTFLPWFIASDSIVVFLFIQTRFIFRVPLGSTVSHLQFRFVTHCLKDIISYILGDYGHARSQGGRSPTRTFLLSLPRAPVKMKAKYIMLDRKHLDCSESIDVLTS